MRAGWLDDITNWLAQQLKALWDALVEFLGDLVMMFLEAVLDLFATMIEALPVPEFLADASMGQHFGQIGEIGLWAMNTFRVGEGLSLIGAAYAFRLLRKFLTAFQW